MNRSVQRRVIVVAFFVATVTHSGSFSLIDRKARELVSTDPTSIRPFAIVHPLGFDGANGIIELRVCATAGSEALIPPLIGAINRWNELRPRYGNCIGCRTAEQGNAPSGAYSVETTLTHELGHCAMGIGHPNLVEIELSESTSTPQQFRTGTCDIGSLIGCGNATSFTASVNATHVVNGNSIIGDRLDVHDNVCPFEPLAARPTLDQNGPLGLACGPCCAACPGASCPVSPMQVDEVAWFRTMDNDPVIIDAEVIDSSTFSRSQLSYPAGSTFAANANILVAATLGRPGSQSVMYSSQPRGQRSVGLAADDSNMVRMGMTGSDRIATTSDDYLILLSYEADCGAANIEVSYVDLGSATTLGDCQSSIALSFPQPGARFHYSVVPSGANPKPIVLVNGHAGLELDFFVSVFWDGFEASDTSEWSATEPP